MRINIVYFIVVFKILTKYFKLLIISYFVNQCVLGRNRDTYIREIKLVHKIGLPVFGPQSGHAAQEISQWINSSRTSYIIQII